jgi:hypothetical protein
MVTPKTASSPSASWLRCSRTRQPPLRLNGRRRRAAALRDSNPRKPWSPFHTSRVVADGERQTTIHARTERQKQTRLNVSKIDELLAAREAGAAKCVPPSRR